jgi:23S rRNA (cytosine1962-C5)-methyltransferase
MFPPHEYQLLDFGKGRKLERFGSLILDRPCPAAERLARADTAKWNRADGRFDRADGKRGEWRSSGNLPRQWTIHHASITLELRPTEFGHLGVFPEQATNWDWIAERLENDGRPPEVLNLFAYTGGGTLATAASGARVVHVDSAKNTVARARRNAELSGMADAPIRWITDDALKFVRRELRRGNGYDAVILDPPSYGHGARGEVWRLSKHLPLLLEMCGRLTAGRRRFILLTCHTPGFDAARLKEIMADALDDSAAGTLSGGELSIAAATGRVLPSGVAVRWEAR